ncbi:hypothetical protein AOLI_G00329850 [Acnodon oligacanthus]
MHTGAARQRVVPLGGIKPASHRPWGANGCNTQLALSQGYSTHSNLKQTASSSRLCLPPDCVQCGPAVKLPGPPLRVQRVFFREET